MIGEYARLTAAEFERAVGDPDWAYRRVRELTEQERDEELPWDRARRFDTDKMWHALDYLLRRIGFPRRHRLRRGGDTRGGGVELRAARVPHPRPGPCRRRRRRRHAFRPADRGPHPGRPGRGRHHPTVVWERGEPLDEVTAHYEALAVFLRAAARDGDGVLVWIS